MDFYCPEHRSKLGFDTLGKYTHVKKDVLIDS